MSSVSHMIAAVATSVCGMDRGHTSWVYHCWCSAACNNLSHCRHCCHCCPMIWKPHASFTRPNVIFTETKLILAQKMDVGKVVIGG